MGIACTTHNDKTDSTTTTPTHKQAQTDTYEIEYMNSKNYREYRQEEEEEDAEKQRSREAGGGERGGTQSVSVRFSMMALWRARMPLRFSLLLSRLMLTSVSFTDSACGCGVSGQEHKSNVRGPIPYEHDQDANARKAQ
jgi:hypothetical protein